MEKKDKEYDEKAIKEIAQQLIPGDEKSEKEAIEKLYNYREASKNDEEIKTVMDVLRTCLEKMLKHREEKVKKYTFFGLGLKKSDFLTEMTNAGIWVNGEIELKADKQIQKQKKGILTQEIVNQLTKMITKQGKLPETELREKKAKRKKENDYIQTNYNNKGPKIKTKIRETMKTARRSCEILDDLKQDWDDDKDKKQDQETDHVDNALESILILLKQQEESLKNLKELLGNERKKEMAVIEKQIEKLDLDTKAETEKWQNKTITKTVTYVKSLEQKKDKTWTALCGYVRDIYKGALNTYKVIMGDDPWNDDLIYKIPNE